VQLQAVPRVNQTAEGRGLRTNSISRIDAYLGTDTLLSRRIALGNPLSSLTDARLHPSKPAATAMATTPELDHVEAAFVAMFSPGGLLRNADVPNRALPEAAATDERERQRRAAAGAAAEAETAGVRPSGLVVRSSL
jgi:hypothetical protein